MVLDVFMTVLSSIVCVDQLACVGIIIKSGWITTA